MHHFYQGKTFPPIRANATIEKNIDVNNRPMKIRPILGEKIGVFLKKKCHDQNFA
jgi:hypothetical protein